MIGQKPANPGILVTIILMSPEDIFEIFVESPELQITI